MNLIEMNRALRQLRLGGMAAVLETRLRQAQAEAMAGSVDLDFLWECCGAEEFGFADLAREYCGHAPSAVEAAGILVKLHSVPVYFYRKGRGRYRAAPPETLRIGPEVEEAQIKRLDTVKHDRNADAVATALEGVRAAAADPTTNVMPALLDAVGVYATIGEISSALADVFGRHTETPSV